MSASEAAHDESHESLIKTPKQLIVVMVLSFAVPVIFLIMMAHFVISTFTTDSSAAPAATVDARIKPVVDTADAATFTLGAAGGGGARTGQEIVQNVCSACHGTGAAGAPKIGDKGAWGPRIAKGLPALLNSAVHGKGAMPARGGVPDLTDFELTRAIVYMTGQSGGSFKEPAAPAPAKAADKK